MVQQGKTHDGYIKYSEGEYWFEVQGSYDKEVTMYHTCPQGTDCNVLLLEETQQRKCFQCGPVEIPDDLWTLYVLMNGRGVAHVE